MNDELDINRQLMEAVKEGELEEVRYYIQLGADVNYRSQHGVTPLIWAYGDPDIMRCLLSAGADVNYTGFWEGTVLMLAAHGGRVKLFTLLMDAGADVNLAMPDSGLTALHCAVVGQQTAAVELLIQAGADVSIATRYDAETALFDGQAKLWGETPLHFAAAYGDAAMITALLDAGASRTKTNKQGEPASAYAGRHMRGLEILQLLDGST